MLFSGARSKQREAQNFLVRFLNSRNIVGTKIFEERRGETRTDLCVGIWVFPLSGKTPSVELAIPAVTKDLSSTGVALVANQEIINEEALLYLSAESESRLLRAKVNGCRAIGAGFHLVAMEVVELLEAHAYPELAAVESLSATVGSDAS